MPRPGPRPYECVRRAWHSDRHQPIRGSLIQEIFRVVNEVHCSATKKNKEWQEKLPIVVLKAEEIMYSKANSEAEYMDLRTLWDRANDAINTIIRRDESTETGGLLQPCIEAALNLGCAPRRASRSQRNCNTRCYLSPYNQEPTSNPSGMFDNSACLVNCATMKPTHFSSEPLCLAAQSNSCTNNKFPFQCANLLPSSSNKWLPMEPLVASTSYSVYPLYYGNNVQSDESQCGSKVLPKLNCSTTEPAENGIPPNHFSSCIDASNRTIQTEFGDTYKKQPENEFDLSLRLGPVSVQCISVENSLPREVEDVSSNSSQEESKFGEFSPQVETRFSFSRKGNAGNLLESSSSILMRKRKAISVVPTEVKQPCSQQKLSLNHFTGGMRNAGSSSNFS